MVIFHGKLLVITRWQQNQMIQEIQSEVSLSPPPSVSFVPLFVAAPQQPESLLANLLVRWLCSHHLPPPVTACATIPFAAQPSNMAHDATMVFCLNIGRLSLAIHCNPMVYQCLSWFIMGLSHPFPHEKCGIFFWGSPAFMGTSPMDLMASKTYAADPEMWRKCGHMGPKNRPSGLYHLGILGIC